MAGENDGGKPIVATAINRLPKSKSAPNAAAQPKSLPLPLPTPVQATNPTTRQNERYDDAIPIRSSRSIFGGRQLKLAGLGIVAVGICVAGIVFAVSRFQLVEQANKNKAANLPQSKPTTAATPISKPILTRPTQPAGVPSTPVKREPSFQPTPKPPMDETEEEEDPFIKPKLRLPMPLLPIAVPSVSALIEQLGDKDETVRLKAAKELGRLKEKAKEAIPALKLALADADEDVREVAKKSLAAIQAALGEKPQPVKPEIDKPDAKFTGIVKDLRSKDIKTRLAAIAQLEELGDAAKPAGATLVEFGMMSPNPAIREAANTAMEKIDPLICKDIITVYYDKDAANKDLALDNLGAYGNKAKPALPVIKAYSDFVLTSTKQAHPKSIMAMVRIAADDETVQKIVLRLVASSLEILGNFGTTSGRRGDAQHELSAREAVVALMHELKIEDKLKITPVLTGFVASDNPNLIKELGKLDVESKLKLPALMTALSKKSRYRAVIINEIAKLGADAKTALQTLKALKTDPEEAVRTAANAAIEAIKE